MQYSHTSCVMCIENGQNALLRLFQEGIFAARINSDIRYWAFGVIHKQLSNHPPLRGIHDCCSGMMSNKKPPVCVENHVSGARNVRQRSELAALDRTECNFSGAEVQCCDRCPCAIAAKH